MNGLRRHVSGPCLAVAIGLSGLWGGVAVADAGRARAHFDLAKRYFQVAEYRKAIDEFKAAHIEAPDPAFLYNIAECHRHLGESQDALVFYRRFLMLAPSNAPTRAIVEKRIAELQAGPRAGQAAAAASGAPVPPAAPPPASSASPAARSPSPSLPASAAAAPSPATGPTAARPVLVAPPPDSTAPAVVVTAVAAPEGASDESIVAPVDRRPAPFYKRGWFYAAVGGALLAGTLGVWAISSSGGKSVPETPLGNQPAFR